MPKKKELCNLILDSCCDLPRHILDDAGVDFFRFPYVMDDGEHLDDLGESMQPKEFYDRMRNGEISTTSQIPTSVLTETFEAAAQQGTPTVLLAFTSGLSGTFETIEHVAADIRKKYPDFELYIVDTRLASIAEGLLAYEAIRQRKHGLGAKQLAEWAEEARWYVRCTFMVDDLEPLRRGGRIPSAAASIGTKLDVKALLGFNLDGSLALSGIARGRKKGLKSICSTYNGERAKGWGEDEIVLIGTADDASAGDWVAKHLDHDEVSIPPLRCDIGPVIGSHVGPGMVAISYWGDDRRESASITDKIAQRFK
ncbi:MAG: DegV family protein [Coriobacteriaceae bacterium]|nr:DegV family protein [Coriobacteriaceae bacterium]